MESDHRVVGNAGDNKIRHPAHPPMATENEDLMVYVKTITEPGRWDSFVAGQPGAHFYHCFHISTVIQAVYSHTPRYLACVENSDGKSRITGILPLFYFNALPGHKKYVSIPFFDAAGLLAGEKRAARLLLTAAFALIQKKKKANLELRQSTPLPAGSHPRPSDLFARVSTVKVDLKLFLQPDEAAMMASFKSKVRSQIKKGLKNGLTARIGKKELLPAFYRVFSENMRDLGSPVHARKLFTSLFDHFYDNIFIAVVYHRGRPAAAGFLLVFKNEMKNPWASSLRAFRHLNTNMVLYWTMIRFACRMKLTYFDMGRSSKNASTYRFKQQWGPKEFPLYWYTCSTDRTFHRRREESLVIPPWKKMPLAASRIAGPWLRGNISL